MNLPQIGSRFSATLTNAQVEAFLSFFFSRLPSDIELRVMLRRVHKAAKNRRILRCGWVVLNFTLNIGPLIQTLTENCHLPCGHLPGDHAPEVTNTCTENIRPAPLASIAVGPTKPSNQARTYEVPPPLVVDTPLSMTPFSSCFSRFASNFRPYR